MAQASSENTTLLPSHRRPGDARVKALDRRPMGAAVRRLLRIRVLRLQIAVLLLKLRAARALDAAVRFVARAFLVLGRRA